MKYYTAEIEERHGDLEFRDKFLLVVEDDQDVEDILEGHAANWRGEENTPYKDLNENGWYDNFEYWTRSLGTTLILEEEYKILKNHIVTL